MRDMSLAGMAKLLCNIKHKRRETSLALKAPRLERMQSRGGVCSETGNLNCSCLSRGDIKAILSLQPSNHPLTPALCSFREA